MPGVTDCSALPIGRRESRAARPKISAAEKYAALNTISAMIEVDCDSIHTSIGFPIADERVASVSVRPRRKRPTLLDYAKRG
jgi:hypothetical protein